MIKTAAILLLSIACIGLAQRRNPHPDGEVKQLESVTWNLKTHKLIWVVQNGTAANGKFEQTSSDEYEITPNSAEMTFAQEHRAFSPQEAAVLQSLLNTLSIYCAESVIWWDKGEGVKLDDSSTPQEEESRPAPREKIQSSGPIALLHRR